MEPDPVETIQLASPHATQHLTEDTLESYSLGCLPESQLARVETHLLVCPPCQDALAVMDDYVAAMKSALAEPVPQVAPSRWATFVGQLTYQLRYARPIPVFAGALAALSLAVVLSQNPGLEANAAEVTLRSVRGGTESVAAKGPAHSALSLKIQSQHLRVDQSFQAKIVDAKGSPEWSGAPEFSHESGYVLHVDTPLAAGSYWVRLYDSEQKLLQEYGLRLE